MPSFAAVIFDMYETLVRNSAALWVQTFDQICQEQGIPLTGQELWDRWKRLELQFRNDRHEPPYPFKSYEQAWRECFERVFQELGKGDAAAAARLSVRDQARRNVYPESAEVIASVRRADHLRLGLLSNADNDALYPLLRLHGLEFDAILCSEEARAYKPDARAFHRIVGILEVAPDECLYVGDSQYDDVMGAHEVGMKTAWVNRQDAPLDPGLPAPDYQVDNLTSLLGIVGIPR